MVPEARRHLPRAGCWIDVRLYLDAPPTRPKCLRTAYSFVANRGSEMLAPEGGGGGGTNTSTRWRACALQVHFILKWQGVGTSVHFPMVVR